MLVDVKMDGVRALWIGGELVTREGAAIHGVEHLADACRALESCYGQPMFLDGELLLPEGFDATARHVGLSAGKADAPEAMLHLFDALDVPAWRGDYPPSAIHERRCDLEDMVARVGRPCLRVVEGVGFSDPRDVEDYAADVIARGEEGVVIKPMKGGYSRSRSGDWLRIKRRITVDCEILGVTPDPDSRERIAGLVVAYGDRVVRITSGFTDAERALLWRERAIITGRLVEIAAMEKTERGSLRQPRFERIRYERIWADA